MTSQDVSGLASDREIVAQVLAGDANSFELIMRRHNRRLYRIARGVLRNDDDAEDVVQEAYVRAFESLNRYQGTGPLSAWLAKITMNEALGRLRNRGAELTMSLDEPEEREEANFMAHLVSGLPDPEQNVARGEIRRLLETAIDALPDAYRVVFILYGVEEMSIAETASCLDVDPGTVKSRYHRARKLLQQQLASLVDTSAGDVYSFDGARCDRIVARVLKELQHAGGGRSDLN